MKSGLIGILGLLLLMGNQCGQSTKASQEQTSLLYGRWLNSFEEEDGKAKIYRREGYDFPLARGRTGFAFLVGGKFEQYDIAPTDGIEQSVGTWELKSDSLIQVKLSDVRAGRPKAYQLKIVSLDQKRLVIELQQP